MLRNLPEHISACLHEAAECRERAAQYDSEELKQPYLDMERRWMKLAQSYEFMEALDRFLTDKDRAKAEEAKRSRATWRRVVRPQWRINHAVWRNS